MGVSKESYVVVVVQEGSAMGRLKVTKLEFVSQRISTEECGENAWYLVIR